MSTHSPGSRTEVGDGGDSEITISTDGQTALPLAEVVTGRGAILGKSGSGKSNSAMVVIEGLLNRGIPMLIVDVEGEYVSLKEEYEVLHAGAHDECDVTVSVHSASTIVSTVLDRSVPVVLDVSEFFNDEDLTELIAEVSRRLFNRQKSEQKPTLLVLEECHEFIPQRGKDDASETLIKITKRGRKRGLGILGLSQRPADVDKAFITQADWLVFHRLTWPNDTAVVKDVIDADHAEAVQSLDTGEGFMLTDWNNSLQRIQWRHKRTSDYGAAPAIERALGTTPDHISADVYAEFEPVGENDLPESVAEYLDHLLDEIASLDKYEQYILDFVREHGPNDPKEGYVLAGGKPGSNAAYHKMRNLRDRRLMRRAGRGIYEYYLPQRVEDQLRFNPEAEEKHIAAVVDRVEEEFTGLSDEPEESEPELVANGETLGTYAVHSRQSGAAYAQPGKPVCEYLGIEQDDTVSIQERANDLVISKAEDGADAAIEYSVYERDGREYRQFTLSMEGDRGTRSRARRYPKNGCRCRPRDDRGGRGKQLVGSRRFAHAGASAGFDPPRGL
ncbi:ATP-binding protein [Halococcus sp. IIIV-5B]|uniref:ATP-binding protein n=1 Tax=Halococcus sp. IIIV-5B TaxID=2321230 RepID=UPI000E719C07|nr:DUF87 domain-containing protein [Halococcus sp. IIIV-5B]RJT07515.1 DUF87 domain-containing protein [Halococcus sp. IIIV-5B]